MSKPIENANRMKDACEFCDCHMSFFTMIFHCGKHNLGEYNDPCTKEDWAHCPFNKQARKPAVKKAPPQTYIADMEKLEFQNRGEFYYNANHYLHLLKKDVDPIIVGLNLDDPAERKAAWLKLIKEKPVKEAAR